MSSKQKSRWANSEEDDARAAKLKSEKEEKRRKKAERARQLQEEAERQSEAKGSEEDGPSRKRRKLTPEPSSINSTTTDSLPKELLRFETESWRKCRDAKKYDKLNDIEEGTYGWVVRAEEKATGKVVALKKLKLEPNDPNGLPVTGLREIQILQDCKHRNIVKLEEVVMGDDHKKLDRYVASCLPCSVATVANVGQVRSILYLNSLSTTSRPYSKICHPPSSLPKLSNYSFNSQPVSPTYTLTGSSTAILKPLIYCSTTVDS